MSGARRAMRIASGYIERAGDLISREWDRIQGVEREGAEQELDEAIYESAPKRKGATDAAEESVEITVALTVRARLLLGVTEKADFPEIRRAFEKLNRRCEPGKFPEGSEARTQAEQIQKRIHWAYNVLTEQFDVTEKRFRSLELD